MTVINKKQVSQFFRRKLGRDIFPGRRVKTGARGSSPSRTYRFRKQLHIEMHVS